MRKSIFLLVFTIMLATLVSAVDLDTCQTLSTANTLYTLNKSVNASGTCFTIQANNITLDGAGFTVNYSQSDSGYAVNNTGSYSDLLIKNGLFVQGSTSTFAHAIYTSGRNTTLQNNTIKTYGSSSRGALFATGASFVTITANTITTFGATAYSLSMSDGVQNTTLTNNSFTAFSFITIYLDSDNNTVSHNILLSNGTAARGITGSWSNSVFSNNTITATGVSSSSAALFLLQPNTNNQFISNTLNSTVTGVIFSGTGVGNNTFRSNTITALTPLDFSFNTAGIEGISLVDQRARNYTITGAGSLVTIENTTYGKVAFTSPIQGNGSDLVGGSSSDIIFGNNSLSLNTTRSPGLNKSANVSLYDIGDRGLSNPAILRNGVLCTNCTNLTSLTADIVTFTISQGGTYSLGEGPAVPSSSSSSASSGGGGGGSVAARISWQQFQEAQAAYKYHVDTEALQGPAKVSDLSVPLVYLDELPLERKQEVLPVLAQEEQEKLTPRSDISSTTQEEKSSYVWQTISILFGLCLLLLFFFFYPKKERPGDFLQDQRKLQEHGFAVKSLKQK